MPKRTQGHLPIIATHHDQAVADSGNGAQQQKIQYRGKPALEALKQQYPQAGINSRIRIIGLDRVTACGLQGQHSTLQIPGDGPRFKAIEQCRPILSSQAEKERRRAQQKNSSFAKHLL